MYTVVVDDARTGMLGRDYGSQQRIKVLSIGIYLAFGLNLYLSRARKAELMIKYSLDDSNSSTTYIRRRYTRMSEKHIVL